MYIVKLDYDISTDSFTERAPICVCPVTGWKRELYCVNDSLQFLLKMDGLDSISFQCLPLENPDDLKLSALYKVYMDEERLYPLPCVFMLKEIQLKYINGIDYYECNGEGINTLLDRVFININRRNIRIKEVLEICIAQTKKKIPELSSDTSLIEDIDFTIKNYQRTNKYFSEIIKEFRDIGYEIYLDNDFKIVLKAPSSTPSIVLDFFNEKVNDTRYALLRNGAQLSKLLAEVPKTNILIRSKSPIQGQSTTISFVGTGDINTGQKFSLGSKLSLDDNWHIESFDSYTLDNMTGNDGTDYGWSSRYRIYDNSVSVKKGMESQMAFQLINKTGVTILNSLTDGNKLTPSDVYIGFMIVGDELKVIVNGQQKSAGVKLKEFVQKKVVSVDSTYTRVTLEDVVGFEVGDTIILGGIDTVLSYSGRIKAISGNVITLYKAALAGEVNEYTRVTREQDYVLRWCCTSENTVRFYIRIDAKWTVLGEYNFNAGLSNFIMTYNNLTGSAPVKIDNGVWELDNIAIDYWWLDEARLFMLWDDNKNEKVVTCLEGDAEIIWTDAVVKNSVENGKDISFVEFINPSIIESVFFVVGQTEQPTINRLPLVLEDTYTIVAGMRVMFRGKEYNITDFFVDREKGYIDITPALDRKPEFNEWVYIDTSIPAANSTFTCTFSQSEEKSIRVCADSTCESLYRYKDDIVDVDNVDDVFELAERAQVILAEECKYKIRGNAGLIMVSHCTNMAEMAYFGLPSVGSVAEIWDEKRGILGERATITGIAMNEVVGDRLSVGIDFGEPEIPFALRLLLISRKLGLFGTDEASTVAAPCTQKDTLQISENLDIDIVDYEWYGTPSPREYVETFTIALADYEWYGAG